MLELEKLIIIVVYSDLHRFSFLLGTTIREGSTYTNSTDGIEPIRVLNNGQLGISLQCTFD